MKKRDACVAAVGCGHWGQHIVRNLAELGRLRCVVEPSPSGAGRARELAPGVPVFDTLEQALGDPAVSAVTIATPAETHHPLARQALLAGRDVFVEKPLTVRLADARDLVRWAEETGRVLMVGHLLEYHPAILELHDLVREGELGKLRYVISNRLNLGKIRTEENALWSFAPHDIAVILRLVGTSPFEVVATGGSYIQPNIADVTVSQLLFDNGVRAHVFVSWLHPFKEQKLVVIGSKKMASFDDVAKELVLYDLQVDWHAGQPVPVRHPGTPVPFGDEEPLRQEILHFLDCVERRCTPRTDGRNGLAVLEILHASQRSIITNGHPVALGRGLEEDAAAASRERHAAVDLSQGHARIQTV
jgi:predicted dehydrogenase